MKAFVASLGLLLLFLSVSGQSEQLPVNAIQLFKPLIQQGEIAGAVTLLADREKIISLEAAGFANLEEQKPMRTDALFWVASQTKPIVAVAFMMLLEEKHISLDDTLYKYIPAFKNQRVEIKVDSEISVLRRPKSPITFRQLLNHTSGMAAEPLIQKGPFDMVGLEEIMPGYAYMNLVQDPGEKEIYSSLGINTVGRLIEIISGIKFEDFLFKRLFEPLGMKNTTFVPSDEQLKRLATTYRKEGKKLKPIRLGFTHPLSDTCRVGLPFGGLFSDAEDLSKFCRMCLNGGELDGKRYLSPDALASMVIRHSPSPFGVGWCVYDNGSYGHNGAYNTDMTIFSKSGLIGISLVQLTPSHPCRSILREAIWVKEVKPE